MESVSMTRPAFLRMSGNMFMNEIVRRQDMDVKWVMKDGLGESKQTQLSFPGTTC